MGKDDVNQEIRAWYENYQRGEQQKRDDARAEGRREGERKLLLRLLQARFGELPPLVTSTLKIAGEGALEFWAVRVLTADSLDAVFAGTLSPSSPPSP